MTSLYAKAPARSPASMACKKSYDETDETGLPSKPPASATDAAATTSSDTTKGDPMCKSNGAEYELRPAGYHAYDQQRAWLIIRPIFETQAIMTAHSDSVPSDKSAKGWGGVGWGWRGAAHRVVNDHDCEGAAGAVRNLLPCCQLRLRHTTSPPQPPLNAIICLLPACSLLATHGWAKTSPV